MATGVSITGGKYPGHPVHESFNAVAECEVLALSTGVVKSRVVLWYARRRTVG